MSITIHHWTKGVTAKFYWALPEAIRSLKQNSMPAPQWISVINSLTSKGIKKTEIEDAKIIGWLTSQGAAKLNKEAVVEIAQAQLPHIKEVRSVGSSATYQGFSHAHRLKGVDGKSYVESVFYFPTVIENLDDEIAALDEEISVLNFNPELWASNPERIIELDVLRQLKIGRRLGIPEKNGITHFGYGLKKATEGEGTNDFAHLRWSLIEKNGEKAVFVHEFQSDWAQRGRIDDWTTFAKAPIVQETEHWAAFLMKAAMRIAVDHGAEKVIWINGDGMKNGGLNESSKNLLSDKPKGVDHFYQKIIPGVAGKLGRPFKANVVPVQFDFEGATYPCNSLEISSEYREHINQGNSSTVYSLAQTRDSPGVLSHPVFMPLSRLCEALLSQRAINQLDLLASPMSRLITVKLIDQVLTSQGDQASASLNSFAINISKLARNKAKELDHEAFHFAMKNLSWEDFLTVTEAFSEGGRFYNQLLEQLRSTGDESSARQASTDPEEAACHAYALWRAGQFNFNHQEAPGGGAFLRVLNAIHAAIAAVRAWFSVNYKTSHDFIVEAREASAFFQAQQTTLSHSSGNQEEQSGCSF